MREKVKLSALYQWAETEPEGLVQRQTQDVMQQTFPSGTSTMHQAQGSVMDQTQKIYFQLDIIIYYDLN